MPTFEHQLEQVTDLISLPEIYLKISSLMDDRTSTIEDFAEVIRFDPNLSATVLKVVNSAFYGFAERIDNIENAVNMIGIGQLNIIALSVSAMSAMDSVGFPNDIVPLKTYWRSSLFSGVLSRQLATQLKIKNSERLFVIGLLHDIGHLVLYTKFPDLARLTLEAAETNNEKIYQSEVRILGCHYGQIGAKLMDKWNLSDSFQNLTRNQPTPEAADEERIETALLHIAHGYAYKKFMNSDKELEDLIDSAAWKIADITGESIEPLLETAHSVAAAMESFILN